VILDGGTTTLQIARHLPHDLRATVVTHSPTIAVALVEHPSIEVHLLGGRFVSNTSVVHGRRPPPWKRSRAFRADLYFMGRHRHPSESRPEHRRPRGIAHEARAAGERRRTHVLASAGKDRRRHRPTSSVRSRTSMGIVRRADIPTKNARRRIENWACRSSRPDRADTSSGRRTRPDRSGAARASRCFRGKS
jgi:hypothetical protein